MITPANKPQGFGFAEFETPEGMIAAIDFLNGVELPALEEGCADKKLLVRRSSLFFIESYLRKFRSRQTRRQNYLSMLTNHKKW